jgi:hypothetical protein
MHLHFLITDIGIIAYATVKDTIFREQMEIVIIVPRFFIQNGSAAFDEIGEKVLFLLIALNERFVFSFDK